MLSFELLIAQNINISNNTVSACGGTFYDSGGTGNYGNNQSFTFTICPSNPNSRVSVNFSSFNLEANYDFLSIYNGNSTTAPLIGTYSGTTSPGVITASLTNASGCLTFRFTTDGSITRAGWVAAISCIAGCQTITSNFVSSNPAPQANGIIRVCQGQAVNFSGNGTFSGSSAGATYSWSIANGINVAGQNASYTFNTAGAYVVNLRITDPSGCTNSNQINQLVQVSTTPTITTSANPTSICQGQSSNLNANVTMTPFNQNCTPPVSGTTFLPDGSGASYTTSITVNCYGGSQVVQSANDIQNVCLNMEHSFMGDLQIRITCPNGQSSILKSYPGGGGTYLGCPIDNTTGGPGTGRNYCFTPTATTLLVNGGTSNCGNPSGASITAGNYMPQQSFNNLIGCPLNGAWTIQVTDNLAADDGYIFNWDINFNSTLLPASGSFTPSIVSQGWVPAATLNATGSTTASVSPTTLGSNCYTYTITDNFGCNYSQNQCITVTSGTLPTFTQLGPYCQGATPGSLPTTSSNGIPGTWSPATISTTAIGATSYTFTPNSGQCAAPYTMTVQVNASPSVSVNSITICSGETGTLTATPIVTGGTYSWSSGATTQSISVNPTVQTNYTVTYSLGTCTPATASGTVTVSPAPTLAVNNLTICSGETTVLIATPDQVGGTYSWSNGATTSSISVSPTSTTSYTVSYSLGSCTSATAIGTVTVNPAPIISITPITICSGETTTLTATPDQPGGTYLWSTGGTNSSISVNPTITTNYSVTYSLGACTPASNTGTITVNPAPTVTITPITICSGETNTLTASPDQQGGTYLWSTGATTTSISVNPTTTNTYSITYSLGACTPATGTAIVTVNPAPTVSINPITICSGETNTLIATPDQPGGTYSWATGETSASISINPTSNTTYSVTYSLGACTPATATGSVTVDPAPIVTITPITICEGETGNLVATPDQLGGTYSWSNGGTTQTIAVNPTITSSYTVTYTLGACTPSVANGTVTVNPAPSVSITPITICSGETGNLTATPDQLGGTYIWSTGATSQSISVNPTTTTTYNVTYTIGACTPAIGNVIVTVTPAPTLVVNSITICSGETNSLTATPSITGGSYVWSSGVNTATYSINPSITTTYTITYTLGACTPAIASGTITVNPTPTITITSPTICSGNTSSIVATPSVNGGTYSWSTGATTATINVNPNITTNYTVTYSVNNCSVNDTTTLTVNPTPVIIVNSSTICNGETATLTANATPTGGTYLWSNAQNVNSISVMPITNSTYNVLYSLTGCNATATASVTVNPIPQVTIASETICAGETTNLTAVPNLPGGTYAWSQGGLSTETIAVNPNSTSNYSVIYTLNNCASPSASATVLVNPVPVLTINSGSICTGQSFTLNAIPSIPGGTFNWISTGETTASITVSPIITSTYSANYTTLQGCTSTISNGTVTISETPNVSFTASILEGCAPLTVTFYNTTQATNDQSNCVWAFNTNSQISGCDSVSYTFNQAGCFDVSLASTANGCVGSNLQTAFICVEDPPIASFQANPQIFTEINQVINFVNTSVGAISYNWEFGDGSTSQLDGPMHYFEGTENGFTTSLTVTSLFGCTATYSLPITYKEPEVYYIPNTFTPDADEHNQSFLPIFTSGVDIHNYLFQIYDRWGQLVFQTTNHLEGWDGSIGEKGKDVQQGTYVYLISFRNPNLAGVKTVNGIVNLIR